MHVCWGFAWFCENIWKTYLLSHTGRTDSGWNGCSCLVPSAHGAHTTTHPTHSYGETNSPVMSYVIDDAGQPLAMTVQAGIRGCQGWRDGDVCKSIPRHGGTTLRNMMNLAARRRVQMIIYSDWNSWMFGESLSLERSYNLEPDTTLGTLYLDLFSKLVAQWRAGIIPPAVLTKPKVVTKPSSPKVVVPKSSPKVAVPKSSPKVAVPKSSPKVAVPKSSPKVAVPKSRVAKSPPMGVARVIVNDEVNSRQISGRQVDAGK